MTDIIFDALRFATDAHTGQFRKSTRVPYIVHPVAVMQYLIQHNASVDAIAAGILHDTLEDTPTTENDLRRVFGDRITNLVIGASEPDKSQTWEQRKEHTICELCKTDDLDQLMVVCADKLSNLSSIMADLSVHGDETWARFKRGYAQQKWYYESLANIFSKHINKSKIFSEYIDIVNQVFCK